MSTNSIVNTIRSTTTNVPGRTLISAREHHFIIDGPSRPNEEVVSMEAFLAGILSCASHLIEDFAEEEGLPLRRVDGRMEAVRPASEPNRFDHIALDLQLTGVSVEQARHLVERFKGR